MSEEPTTTSVQEPDTASAGSRTFTPPLPTLRDVEGDFSASVRRVARALADGPVTLWQVVHGLIEVHRDYGGEALLPLAERDGERAPVVQWLLRVRVLFDVAAVTRSKAEFINTRLSLLAAARLSPEVDALFRTVRLVPRLRRDLEVPASDVFRPWALPGPIPSLVRVTDVASDDAGVFCTVSSDGRWLVFTGTDSSARLWEPLESRRPRALATDGGLVWGAAFPAAGAEDVVATWSRDGTARIWDLPGGGQRAVLRGHTGAVTGAVFTPDGGLLLTRGEDGDGRLWASDGRLVAVLGGHVGPVYWCDIAPDGSQAVTAGVDGTGRLWALPSGRLSAALTGHTDSVVRAVFSPDGTTVATTSADATARLWSAADGSALHVLSGHTRNLWGCAFSPDSSLLATTGDDGTTRVWDVFGGTCIHVMQEPASGAVSVLFTPDGRSLMIADQTGGLHLLDVVRGKRRDGVEGHRERIADIAQSADGSVVVTTGQDGTAVIWESVAAPSALPRLISDTVGRDRRDLLGLDTDVRALADVIAAAAVTPPLSIGLFGDWGSGKSFLIEEVQTRVRQLARRSRRTPSGSAYCGHIRNITFNAWHYADGNLWASLVTHIFDELGRPEPEAGIDQRSATAQVARLREELARHTLEHEQLEQAAQQSTSLTARRQLRILARGAVGSLDPDDEIAELKNQTGSVVGWLRLLFPTARSALVTLAMGLVLAGLVALVILGVGLDGARAIVAGVGTWLAAATGLVTLWTRRIARLVDQAGRSIGADLVTRRDIAAQLEASRRREQQLREEIADIASGRRLGAFITGRGATGDYRDHLGVVSRIHTDFRELAGLLSAAGPTGADKEGAARSGLPRIERIVLYIDDLDRCPPQRVVEVLEAVHLILALRLFVVVLAVDPRWLKQSLALHYRDLLAGGGDGAPDADLDGGDPDGAHRPTPLDYLEKIIQVPFTLRPMSPVGVGAMIRAFLPQEVTAGDTMGAPREEAAGAAGARPAMTGRDAPSAAAGDGSAAARGGTRRAPSGPAPSLNPRTLGFTAAELEVATWVASVLRTPRAVKKYTNLYRLIRAGIDEGSGRLDEYLEVRTNEIPEYEAVLVLLAVLIRFPDDAPDLLTSLGDIDPDAPASDRAWREFLAQRPDDELTAFLTASDGHLTNAATGTVEPFRRWALEVSRYSFTTGMEVYARFRRAPAAGP